MSDETRETECEAYAADLGELALGVLTGRERAQALWHVESCPRCAEELEQLSRAADAVLQVAPEVEPPLGFETRLFERMGVADVRPSRGGRHRARRFWIPVSVAAAVVALAVGLGLGLSSSGPTTTSAQGEYHHGRITGALMENGRRVGTVVVFDGSRHWMQMMLDDSSAHGQVTCVVVTDDGVHHQVGTFVASEGYGAWAAPLHVNPDDVRSAEVVSSSGTVIATATLD
jgi:anti-sigma-K factor RskA